MMQESDITRKLQTNRTSAQDANNAVINTGDYVILSDMGVGPKGQLSAKKEQGGELGQLHRVRQPMGLL